MRTITDDVLALLRAANPVPLDTVARATDSAVAHAIFDHIVATPVGAGGERDRRYRGTAPRRRRVAALVGTAALSISAVAYALVTRDVTKPLTVACYQTASLEAGRVVQSADGRTPVDACAAAWRAGRLQPAGEPPPLVACVLGSRVAAVFPALPGGGTCAALGLDDLPAPVPTVSPSVVPSVVPTVPAVPTTGSSADLRDALTTDDVLMRCLSPQEATTLAEAQIARLGLPGWAVVANAPLPFPPDRPCATFGFDTERRQVLLIPGVPRR